MAFGGNRGHRHRPRPLLLQDHRPRHDSWWSYGPGQLCGLRRQHKPLPLGCTSTPSLLQFCLSSLRTSHSISLSLPFLHVHAHQSAAHPTCAAWLQAGISRVSSALPALPDCGWGPLRCLSCWAHTTGLWMGASPVSSTSLVFAVPGGPVGISTHPGPAVPSEVVGILHLPRPGGARWACVGQVFFRFTYCLS